MYSHLPFFQCTSTFSDPPPGGATRPHRAPGIYTPKHPDGIVYAGSSLVWDTQAVGLDGFGCGWNPNLPVMSWDAELFWNSKLTLTKFKKRLGGAALVFHLTLFKRWKIAQELKEICVAKEAWKDLKAAKPSLSWKGCSQLFFSPYQVGPKTKAKLPIYL